MKQGRPVQTSGKFAGQPYQHGQAHYAKEYGVTPRQVKRWWADRLPCDDPDAMGEWRTNRGRKPSVEPPRAVAAPDFTENDPPRRPVQEQDQSDAGAWLAERRFNLLGEGDPTFLEGEGIAAAVARISKVELKLAAKLDEELSRPGNTNFRELDNRLAAWIGMLKTMGKLEKDTPGILEQHKKQIDIGEVEEGVTKLLVAIVGRLAMLPTRATQTLFSCRDRVEFQEGMAKEVQDALEPIRACEWMPADVRADLFPAEASAS